MSFQLTSPENTSWLRNNAVGAVMPNLNETVLRRLPLLVPPLDEQKRMGSLLGSLDDKIDLSRRMNETLEAMARAIFKSWFVDFDPVWAKMEGRQTPGMDPETALLFPNAFESTQSGLIPTGWRISPIDSTSVTSPRRARIFWKFSGRSSRLVDVARALFQIAPVSRD
jgi:type I restriction enzyme S subunit